MKKCKCLELYPTYRITQTILERNNIPCNERIEGMIVTVIEASKSVDSTGTIQGPYTQYMLQGNPCLNSNWKKISIDSKELSEKVGHSTENSKPSEVVNNEYLNNRYPKALEGFKVTLLDLNSTFMKISGNRWVLTNNILNNE